MISFLNTYTLSILGLAALTVLTALGDVSAAVTVPLIVAIVGVHTGASISSPAPVVAQTQTKTTTSPVTPATPTA